MFPAFKFSSANMTPVTKTSVDFGRQKESNSGSSGSSGSIMDLNEQLDLPRFNVKDPPDSIPNDLTELMDNMVHHANADLEQPVAQGFQNSGEANFVVFRKHRPAFDSVRANEKAENKLEEAIFSQKGKPFDKIMPYKMEPCFYHKPSIRSGRDVMKHDDVMKEFYENAKTLDDKMFEFNDCNNCVELKDITWEEMHLNKQLIECLKNKCHYKEPRHVQSAVIPRILEAKHVVCQAENASGKTMGYIVPIIDHLITQLSAGLYKKRTFPTPIAVILVPTHELAIQITEQFNKILDNIGTVFGKAVACYGQTDETVCFVNCANAEIIVACPGRLHNFLTKRRISTESLQMIVLDEIDVFARDNSFIEDLNGIKSCLADECQYMFFSSIADVRAFCFIDEWTGGNHCSISNNQKMLAAKVQFKFSFVKESVIRGAFCADYIKKYCISKDGSLKALVFCDTRDEAFKMTAMLQSKDFEPEVMSSDMSQAHREEVFKKLRNAEADSVVFTTNVLARGLDVAEVEHVVILKFDMNSDFLDRCGRIGRLKDGYVHVFLTESASQHDMLVLEKAIKTIGHSIPDEVKRMIRSKHLIEFKTHV